MPRKSTARFVAHDSRKRTYTGLGAGRFPWLIVDTATGKVVDELYSGRAARSTAAAMNRAAKAAKETPNGPRT